MSDRGLQVRLVQQDPRIHAVQQAAGQFRSLCGRHHGASDPGTAPGQPDARETGASRSRNVRRSRQGPT